MRACSGTFDRLRDALALRIKAIPAFREKLANSPLNLDHPVWVDDEKFDIGRHLHRIDPLGPNFHGSGLNITAMSLQGKLDIGWWLARICCRPYGRWPTSSRWGWRSRSRSRGSRRRCR